MYQYLLLSSVVIPIVAAALCYLAAPWLGRRVGWVAFAALFITTAALVFADGPVLFSGGAVPAESYAWAPSAGLTFGFLADGLSFPIAVLVNLVLAATAVYSMPYMQARIKILYGEDKPSRLGLYYLNFLLVGAGLIGIVFSTNLVELYLFLELVLVPTFVIISLFGYVQKERVAIIYIIWNQLGAFIFLAGIALFYSAAGTFNLTPASLAAASSNSLAYWIVGLILVGWLVKMAVFGVHMWLPITEAEPPTSFAPTMAVVSGIGVYVIARVLFFGMTSIFSAFSLPLMAWAVLTMFYGGMVAMVQNDVKYIFAWSTMSQTAYSVLGLASTSALGAAGAVFFFGSQILGKFVMFAVAGIIVTQVGTRDVRKLGGLAAKMPFTAALFVLGALILSAVPPTSGFQSEWIMFAGIFSKGAQGSGAYLAVAILGLIATLFTVAYTFWPIKRMFFGPLASGLDGVKEAPLTMTVPLLAIVVVSILIGIYPDLVSKFLIGFANAVTSGGIG
ncbi:MAG: NADH dehydrogenase [Nitrososphaerota archaeon]|nr:NADH dehydrogenase [Nitrososphaerota archaeon]